MTDQVSVKLPNAMTRNELLIAGKSPEAADRIMHERVFGKDFQKDKDGNPVEQGFGSEANPNKGTHNAALALAKSREANSSTNADVIAAAVAAGVKAGLAAAKDEDRI